MKQYIYPRDMVDRMLERGCQLVKIGHLEFLADKNGGIIGGDPVTIAIVGLGLSAASTGIGLYGTSQAKKDAKKAQTAGIAFDARTAKLESKALLEEAALEAIEIRREGELFGKKQKALTAKAGLKLGRGTAKDIQEETKRLTEKDVATTLSAAERKSKQLLETYPEPGGSVGGILGISAEKARKLIEKKDEKEDGDELTALESEDFVNPGNFIRSKKTTQTLLGDL